MTESVAIVGFGPDTRELVKDTTADEIWTCNFAFLQDFLPRIDRMFDIHPLWLYQPKNYKKALKRAFIHWDWLQKEHDFPVYIQELDERVPSGVRYPLEEVSDYIFGDLMKPYYTSSFPYMLGLAIYEKIKLVELYGFEMHITDTEYRYQRPCAEFMIGVATGKGIKVIVPEKSPICKAPLYGYERIQMIMRQDLERNLINVQNQRDAALAMANKSRGKWEIMLKFAKNGKATQEGVRKAQQELEKAIDLVSMCNGGVQALEHLIAEIDMDEHEMEFVNPMVEVEKV